MKMHRNRTRYGNKPSTCTRDGADCELLSQPRIKRRNLHELVRAAPDELEQRGRHPLGRVLLHRVTARGQHDQLKLALQIQTI